MRLPLPKEEIKKLVVGEGLAAPERFDELFAEAERKNQSIIDLMVSEGIATAEYMNGLIAKSLGVDMVDFSNIFPQQGNRRAFAGSYRAGASDYYFQSRTERYL